MRLRWSRLGRAGWPLLGLYLAVVGAATAVFAGRRPVPETSRYSVPAPLPGVRTNFAALSGGAVLRVSSFDWFHSHHPLYAIDEQAKPDKTEKWATVQKDRAPWIEIELAVRVDVDEIDLVLAGAFEAKEFTNRDFVVRCLRDQGAGETVVAKREVSGNEDPRPKVPLACPGTNRVRIEFLVEPIGKSRDVARVYEVSVWGKPAAP
ncbi:MAG: hypothetical protein HY905_25330 [Deltaproteobacteria bacterium]|nr:hypothetical protein [Deltaproteobacteria bacterium]